MSLALFSAGGADGHRVLVESLRPLLNPVPTALNDDHGRPAAVLVGLQWGAIDAGDAGDADNPAAMGWHVIMTERAQHLAHHAGQISFPGGKVESADTGLQGTALREAAEEISLDAAHVTVLGGLDPVRSPVGFVVQPVVAVVETGVSFQPEPNEVAAILHLPLAHVLDPKQHRRDRYLRNGEPRDFWVIDHPQHYLWGLSATILVDLARRLANSADMAGT